MTTITEFLLAGFAEEEAVTRKALDMRTGIFGEREPDMDFIAWEDIGVPSVVVGVERALADIGAKRAIVEKFEWYDDRDYDPENFYRAQALQHAMRFLATVYADHPDYREEWKP